MYWENWGKKPFFKNHGKKDPVGRWTANNFLFKGGLTKAGTYRLWAEGEGGRVFTATDTAVTLDLTAEGSPPPVNLRVRPVTLTLYR